MTAQPQATFRREPGLTLAAVMARHLKSADEKKGQRHAVIAQVDRQNTAVASVGTFFTAVNQLEHQDAPGPDAAFMAAVGLRLDGRSSTFDLWWFRPPEVEGGASASGTLYAVDVRDNAFVCGMQTSATPCLVSADRKKKPRRGRGKNR